MVLKAVGQSSKRKSVFPVQWNVFSKFWRSINGICLQRCKVILWDCVLYIILSSLWEHFSSLLKYNALLNQVSYLWIRKMSLWSMGKWNVIIILARIQEAILIETPLNLILVLIGAAQAPEESLKARRIWVLRAGNQTSHECWTLSKSTISWFYCFPSIGKEKFLGCV